LDELEIAERMKLPNSCCLICAFIAVENLFLFIMKNGHLNLGNCCPVTEAANRATLLTGGIVDDG
jgi:hypothetical protein